MSKEDRLKYAALNMMVRQDYKDFKDPDDYIYASLSQPPIRVIDKHGTDDELEWTVECPNCKRAVNYGHEIFMVSGHIYCSDDKCRDEVYEKVNVKKGGKK